MSKHRSTSTGGQTLEFKLMVDAGFTPVETLRAATVVNASLLRMQDRIGTIERGKYADIIAFNGDPLEDITVMQHCRFIMKDGKIIKND